MSVGLLISFWACKDLRGHYYSLTSEKSKQTKITPYIIERSKVTWQTIVPQIGQYTVKISSAGKEDLYYN
jgi:hypothetical protein